MVSQSMLEYSRLGLRITQSVFSLIAMCCAGGAFAGYKSGDITFHLGSPVFNFIMLISYSAWMCTMGWIAMFHVFKYSAPPATTTYIFDGLFIVLYFCAAIAGAVSDYVKECDSINLANATFIRCGVVKTAVAFSFLAMFAFIGTLTSKLLFGEKPPRENDIPMYSESQTPTTSAVPFGNAMAPQPQRL